MVNNADEQLLGAVEKGDLKGVRNALAHGANVNAVAYVGDAYSQTSLIIAVADGNYGIAKLLLESGANPNFQINGEDWNGMSALMWAAMKGYHRIAKLLLKHDALVTLKDEHDFMAYDFAIENNHKEIAKLLEKKSKDKNVLLLESVDSDNLNGVEEALKKGADVNSKYPEGDTPLLRACNPTTPEIEVAVLLVKHGAKVDAKTKDEITSLMLASIRGESSLVSLFLKKGADVDARDKQGRTALMYAADSWRCWPEVVKILLKNGADLKIKDKDGKTAYDLAENKCPERLKLVKSPSQGRIHEPYTADIKEIINLLKGAEKKK
ncbi:MAG: ankyrin repeat domain-containing protein [Candidatus Micrarchaeota archaeon]